MMESADHLLFSSAVKELLAGNFSRLEPLLVRSSGQKQCRILEWHDGGYFADEPAALQEAFTCACFLGKTRIAEFLLKQGVDPNAGSKTGVNAFHWAVNRGHLDTVNFLIRKKLPLETKNRFGGTVLGMAVWSAIHEPRPNHAAIIKVLLAAGARLESFDYPTGDEQADELLRSHGAT
jgi:ankyrin repeat protein